MEGWRRGGAAAAGERSDARDEFAEVERLGEVVVGTESQSFNSVLDGVGGGQHQHATLGPLGHECPADLIAMQLGQVAVEHDHVVGDQPRACQRFAARVGDVDGDPFTAQTARDRVGQELVIFDN